MRRSVLFTTLFNGIAALSPQILGLLTLSSREFGVFSVGYLIFAFGSSVMLSILCDPWVMSRPFRSVEGWRIYSTILVTLCLIFACLSFGISILVSGDWIVSSLTVLGVSFGLGRVGLRHLLVFQRDWKVVFYLDFAAIFGTFLGFMVGYLFNLNELSIVLFAWAGGGACGSIAGGVPGFALGASITWLKAHRKTIRRLLSDSLVMDAASIGTPYLLLPLLGLGGFGIYRAVSNLSAPIRLALSPIRSLVLSNTALVGSRKVGTMLGFVAFIVSLTGGLLMVLVENRGWVLGVLSDVAVYAVPTGIFLFSSVLISVYPLICRAEGTSKIIAVGRGIQSVAGVVLPVVGYFSAGISGSVWGLALGALVSGTAWVVLAQVVLSRTEVMSSGGAGA